MSGAPHVSEIPGACLGKHLRVCSVGQEGHLSRASQQRDPSSLPAAQHADWRSYLRMPYVPRKRIPSQTINVSSYIGVRWRRESTLAANRYARSGKQGLVPDLYMASMLNEAPQVAAQTRLVLFGLFEENPTDPKNLEFQSFCKCHQPVCLCFFEGPQKHRPGPNNNGQDTTQRPSTAAWRQEWRGGQWP